MDRTSQAGHYHERIDRVIDHIYAYVDEDLSLDILARIAGFLNRLPEEGIRKFIREGKRLV